MRGGVRRFRAWTTLAGVLLVGCAGGMPSIPNTPADILKKADSYFARNKYFQSQELYKAFLQRYPGDDRSDYAQFRLAESLYSGEEYGLAAVEYHILVNDYGYSEYVDDGYFKESLCFYYQALKPPLDQSKRLEAMTKLERFITVFPQSPLVPEARDHLEKIHATLAEKSFATAMFYLKQKRRASAIIYLDKIIDSYPNNLYWARALYYKGTIVLARGETDEAIRLFSQVMAYPEDVDVKQQAKRELQRLRNG